MLRMDQVHVIRHKVLVEGQSVRSVARQLGMSRNTVRKYLLVPAPVRVEHRPRHRPHALTFHQHLVTDNMDLIHPQHPFLQIA